MFNLSGSEIVVILLLALVVLGPDKLPEAMRRAGKTWAELRKLSSGFQEEVRKGFDEPTAEVRQTANAIKKAATLPKNPVKGAVKSLLDPPKPYTDATATTGDVPAEAAIEAEAAAVIGAEVEAAIVDADADIQAGTDAAIEAESGGPTDVEIGADADAQPATVEPATVDAGTVEAEPGAPAEVEAVDGPRPTDDEADATP